MGRFAAVDSAIYALRSATDNAEKDASRMRILLSNLDLRITNIRAAIERLERWNAVPIPPGDDAQDGAGANAPPAPPADGGA